MNCKQYTNWLTMLSVILESLFLAMLKLVENFKRWNFNFILAYNVFFMNSFENAYRKINKMRNDKKGIRLSPKKTEWICWRCLPKSKF